MKINKSDFAGTGSVFKFTFSQFIKSKANLISMAILFIFALLSVPVMGLVMGSSAPAEEITAEVSSVEKVYIVNETALDIPTSRPEGEYWQNCTFLPGDGNAVLSESDVLVKIAEEGGEFSIKVSPAEETYLSSSDIYSVSAEMESRYYSALASSLGVTQEQLEIINGGYSISVLDESELAPEEEFSEAAFAVQYAYSIIVLILCTNSTMYIVRSVLEEKASKLVELLMVSIKPMALIMGKIFAVMAFMFIQLAGLFVCYGLSWKISGIFFDTSAVEGTLSGFDLDFIAGGIGFDTAVIVLVSLALAYLTVSIIAGISGACCNSMQEADSAATSSMLLVLGGYLASCIVGAVPNGTLSVVSSLIPVLSVFCAPVQYFSGNINLWVMVGSLLIQLGVVIFLFDFCAKVYSYLIIHSGSRIKMKELFSIAKSAKKEAKENE